MRVTRWRIYYRSGEDEVTERVIRELVPEPPSIVHATCELRNETRSFRLDRIEWAIDADTAEIIPDAWVALGLPSQAPAPPAMPTFAPVTLSADQARNQRRADKAALFSRFKHPVIAAIKHRQVLALFKRECFRCQSAEKPELDHHVPQSLGGRLIPGNIVLLCGSCNRLKPSAHPDRFYSPEQLHDLEHLLREQLNIFHFKLNYARWLHHPEHYLRSLGATDEEVEAAITDLLAQRGNNKGGIGVSIHADMDDDQPRTIILERYP